MLVTTVTVSPELIDGLVEAHGTAMQPLSQAYGRPKVGKMDLEGERLVNVIKMSLTQLLPSFFGH